MQVSEWGSSGHGWSAMHPLITEDILLPRSYAPEILVGRGGKASELRPETGQRCNTIKGSIIGLPANYSWEYSEYSSHQK